MTIPTVNLNNPSPPQSTHAASKTMSSETTPSENMVVLSDSALDWATTVCQPIPNEDEQWHTFLRALAVVGFDQWLNDGALVLAGSYAQSSPPAPGVNFHLNGQRLCIVAMGSLSDDRLQVPNPTDGGPAPQLYILVEVQEEVGQVQILAGLPAQQLQQLPVVSDPWVEIPVSLFTLSPEQILVTLSAMQPETVTAVTPGASSFPSPLQRLQTRIINTGQWINSQLDDISEQLAWALLPPRTVGALRDGSPLRNTLDEILQELANHGTVLPSYARGVGGPVQVGDVTCQLQAWAWPLTASEDEPPEWSLLLLLGPADGATLPVGTRLIVSDQNGVIALASLSNGADGAYLYTQVVGTQGEAFVVKVDLPDGESATLPPFGYEGPIG
ncbi:MAG: DUF1822 family protein [Cyanobacteria bacterium J06632_22]